MKPFRPSWSEIRRRLTTNRKKLLFLDFDGTLAPIAKDPESVKLDARTKRILSRLRVSDSVQLCIISGRRVRVLRSILGMKDICYVGNHGFEIEVPDVALSSAAMSPETIRRSIAPVASRLKTEFDSFPGVLLEDKKLTLSLHFRNVTHKDLRSFRKKFQDLKRKFQALPLTWREGKRVLEIVPKTDWSKGSAALLVLDLFSGWLPVVLGDDRTDEDMFHALRKRGITVRVGRSKNSAAEYYLTSQKQVTDLLEKFLDPER